ncbi:MAG: carboxymuconolactone decarboxylase family protein [Dehalococcoidia bacterium]|nr:carboxymuconolactone decarboxylase family protein [Dehalococcoidia bacterium]
MPRLRQVSKNDAPDEVKQVYQGLFGDRDPVAEPGTATGTPGNWWTVFALVPDVLAHAQRGFALVSSRRRQLTPQQREVALTRTGFAQGSQFVFSQHCKAARSVGLTDEQLEHIPSWGISDRFDAAERAILAFTDEMVLADGRVQDGTFAALKQHLSDEAILELAYTIGTYMLHATITRALRLEYDDVPERIVEIAAPEGQKAADVMGAISRE